MSPTGERHAASAGQRSAAPPSAERSVFTVVAAGEWLGVPIGSVRTIFRTVGVTPIPLAPHPVLGLVNLRGKIVTAVSLRRRLGLEDLPHGSPLAVGVEHRGEEFALVVDEVREVAPLSEDSDVPIPANMHAARVGLVREVCRTGERMLSVLDMDALFDFGARAQQPV